MIKEFKEFAFKGNMVDMAVGFILGGAFATVVKSLVDNVVMPPLGAVLASVQFSDMKYTLQEGVEGSKAVEAAEGQEAVEGIAEVAEVAIFHGQFIQDLISFVLLALVVFIVVKKLMGAFDKKEEEAPEAPAQEVLLEEIRDLLKKSA